MHCVSIEKNMGVKDVNKSLYLCKRFREILRDLERFLVAFNMNRFYCKKRVRRGRFDAFVKRILDFTYIS